MSDRCPHCQTPLSPNGDLDENGLPFCDCSGAEVDRLTTRVAELEAAIMRANHELSQTIGREEIEAIRKRLRDIL